MKSFFESNWKRYISLLAISVSLVASGPVRGQDTTTPEQLHPDYSPIINTIDNVAKRSTSTAIKVVFLLDAADWADARTQQLREFVQTYVDANTTKLKPCDSVGIYLYRDKLLTGSDYEQPVAELVKARDGILRVKNMPELPTYAGHTDPYRALSDLYTKERDCVYVLLSRMASPDKPDTGMTREEFEKGFGDKIRHEPDVNRSILVSAEKGRKTWAYFDVYRSAEYKSDLPCGDQGGVTGGGTNIGNTGGGGPEDVGAGPEWLLLLLLPAGILAGLALNPLSFRVTLDGDTPRGFSVSTLRPTKIYINLKENKIVDEMKAGVVALVVRKHPIRGEFTVNVEPASAKCTGNDRPVVLKERHVITVEHNSSKQRITFSKN